MEVKKAVPKPEMGAGGRGGGFGGRGGRGDFGGPRGRGMRGGGRGGRFAGDRFISRLYVFFIDELKLVQSETKDICTMHWITIELNFSRFVGF